jgi:hypothetical protein
MPESLLNGTVRTRTQVPLKKKAPVNNFGLRLDGTPKGLGYYGELKRRDGSNKISTEISAGFDWGKGETQIPLLVPGLDKKELDFLLKMELGKGAGKVPRSIKQKAVDHAKERISKGLSPFK